MMRFSNTFEDGCRSNETRRATLARASAGERGPSCVRGCRGEGGRYIGATNHPPNPQHRRSMAALPSRDEALALMHQHVQGESLRRHMYSVEAACRAYARRFGEDEELYGLSGLLH